MSGKSECILECAMYRLGSVSKLLFHGLREGARIRQITQCHGGRNNGSFVTDG